MLKHIFVSTLTAAVLAACSSSGSSETVTTRTVETVPSTIINGSTNNGGNTATTTPSTPSNTANTSSNQPVNGVALVSTVGNGASVQPQNVSSSDKNSITLNGRTFTLFFPGIYSGGWQSVNGLKVSNHNLSYVKLGAYQNTINNQDKTINVFAIGDNMTPSNQMPTTGKAHYSGVGLLSNTGGGNFAEATSSFDVDFTNKSIGGTVKANNSTEAVNLSGTINGAAFSGNQNGIRMNGHFYGNNAAELGGVFNGTVRENGMSTNYMGAFGAKKQ